MARYTAPFAGVTFSQTALAGTPATGGAFHIVGNTNTLAVKFSEIYMGGEAPSTSTPASMAFGRTTTAAGTPTGAVVPNTTDSTASAAVTTAIPNTYTAWTTGPAMTVAGVLLRLSFNAYGGIVRWVSSPDQQLVGYGSAVFTGQGNGGQFQLQQVTSTGGVNALISGHILFELV